jgi:hypothetical protein
MYCYFFLNPGNLWRDILFSKYFRQIAENCRPKVRTGFLIFKIGKCGDHRQEDLAKFGWSSDGSRTWGKKCGRLPLEEQAERPAIANKTWQAENLDDRLGRTRPTSACYCSSPSGQPTNCGVPFSTLPESTSFIVQLRVPACSPACIPEPFSHCTQYRHCVSQDDDGFKLFTSLVYCASHTAPPAPLKSKRYWKDDSTAWLMDLFEEKFLANSAWTAWHSNNGKKFYWGLRRHFQWPLRALGLKFSSKYIIKCWRNLINWNRSIENPVQVNANAMVWAMFTDLGQDCQGLWHSWRHRQCCSNWLVGGSAQEPVNLEETEEHDAHYSLVMTFFILHIKIFQNSSFSTLSKHS